ADRVDALVNAGAVLPDQCAAPGVEREDVAVAGREIHDAVLDDRRSLHRVLGAEPRAQVHHPGALEALYIAAVDLAERRIARIAPVAPDGEPLLGRRFAQIGGTLGHARRRYGDGASQGRQPEMARPVMAHRRLLPCGVARPAGLRGGSDPTGSRDW